MTWPRIMICVVAWLGTAQALAQTPEQAPQPAPAPATPAPTDSKTTVVLSEPPPEPPPPPPPPGQYVQTYDANNPPAQVYGYVPEHDRFGQVSGYFGIPMWLSDVGDMSPGFSFEGRFGFDLGYFVPEVGFGTQINWFDYDTGVDGSLSAFWFTLGARFQWLNSSMFTPFLSGALDMNWWHISGDNYAACDYYYCYIEDNYRFAPGFSGRLGAAIQVHPQFALELGLRLAMTFEGSLFDEAESWLSPFFGGSFYF